MIRLTIRSNAVRLSPWVKEIHYSIVFLAGAGRAGLKGWQMSQTTFMDMKAESE